MWLRYVSRRLTASSSSPGHRVMWLAWEVTLVTARQLRQPGLTSGGIRVGSAR